MKNKLTTKTIAGLGVLTALVVVLQLFSNYVQFGPVSITLALTPVVVGACLYGPLGGLFLGLVQGALVMVAPSTMASFMPFLPWGTVLTCLLKSALAGLASAFMFKAFAKKSTRLAAILAAVVAPIVNTGVFTIFAFTLFLPLINDWFNASSSSNILVWYLISMVGVNFIIEFFVNSLLSPVVQQTYEYFDKRSMNK